jgi:[ribosomal protein S5]-alanine N-acetyltransferase
MPQLLTERLRLRPFAPGDAPDVQRLAGAREIAETTLFIPHPYPDGLAATWIATHAARFESGKAAVFAVTLRQDGTLVGAAELGITREHRRAELGYWIGREHWGQGLATEAARRMLGYAFDELDLNRLQAHHFTRNPASGRVLLKIGMRYEGRSRQYLYKWDRPEDVDRYALLREEWAG